jgi:GNAT superfamily N-acetyltransferase
MIDFSLIKTIPAGDVYNEFFFQARKEAFWWLIERVWGKWDEAFQRKTFAEEMEGLKPNVILYKNQPIGCCCLTKQENYYIFEAFFILPKYQNQGIGSFVLKKSLEIADKDRMTVRLRHWNFNPAASLYARMGFEEIGRIEFEGRKDYLV